MSRSYPHTEPRGELTVYKDIPCTHKHTQTNIRMSVEASFYSFFSPTIPHAQSTFFSKQRFVVFVFHYNMTRKGMRGNGRGRGEERSVVQRARREEFMWMWEKYTTLFHWLFITEGKQGPPQSLPHHHKYGGEMSVCVCWEECMEEVKENRGGK